MRNFLPCTAVLLTFLCSLQGSEGRGRLVDPPARASMWRFGFKTPVNYNDNGLNCGGPALMWGTNQGRCGVCGDPYNGVRENEAGGKYATGLIARTYTSGQMITAKVEVSANERGWFEFNLCAHNDPSRPVTEACLNATVLQLTSGGTRYYVPSTANGVVSVDLDLPAGVTCSQCVFRWRWNAGNMWGWDKSGNPCLGCGHQEQFFGCSDVTITSGSGLPVNPATRPPPVTTAQPTTTSTSTTTPQPTTTSTPQPTTTKAPTTPPASPHRCHGINNWQGDPSLDLWCEVNCLQHAYCPAVYCTCDP
ncbi:uncharacterized protein LOC101864263 [Aplysia californica]|uniref:Uncharacterized protein LOC101864263 n=1 Tax=Aplysia californica TaxID=6500 RepID=A0ABM1ABI1_APLCA|nr:uncharacterized protein LOC101864263 [Aplysia californica]